MVVKYRAVRNPIDSKHKKELMGEMLKIVEIENSKRKKATAKETKIKEVQKKEIIKEVTVQVDKIRTEKKEKKLKANACARVTMPPFLIPVKKKSAT